MKRFLRAFSVAALFTLLSATPAMAAFGFEDADLTFTDENGDVDTRAGVHPFAVTTEFDVNTVIDAEKGEIPEGTFRDIIVELPPGFAGTPTPGDRCSTVEFLEVIDEYSSCPDSSAIGVTFSRASLQPGPDSFLYSPVYNLEPPPGVAAKFGFIALAIPVTIEVGVNETPPHNVIASVTSISQAAYFYGSRLTLWGVPADPAHDPIRGQCVDIGGGTPQEAASRGAPGECSLKGATEKPFITLPRACTGPLTTVLRARSWEDPGTWIEEKAITHDETLGMTGCSLVGFAPEISAQPTTDRAESPSGLDFNLDITDPGLANPDGTAHSDTKKAVVTLPEGVTANPSVAEGLATCSMGNLENERVDSEPGEGCPQASKLGTVEVESPLLEGKILEGALFIAQQDDPATTEPGRENPFDSLLALHMVIKDPGLGILVKLSGKVEPDPETGQLTTTFDEIPQLPVSHFRLHFREGGRSPLITPPGCGSFTTEASLTPWANPGNTLVKSSTFQITRGVGGGPCPPAGTPPFAPGFEAGSLNNNAGSHTPFYMRITRADGEQDMTRFSSTLPPGLLGKLAGVDKCSDAAIASAKTRRGRVEIADPSCPVNSQIGRVLAGAGVGSQLTYVGGKAYLAGPYNGAPLSVVVITPAVAGPFDVGTVVVRVALKLDPKTAEVQADGAASDPIPHILAGIPLKVRDLRVYIDRPNFVLNPTSCDPSQVRATLWGGGSQVFSSADDVPVPLAARFQAANCSRLGFKPRLSISLKGGTKRGGHPALRAVLQPRPGDANLSKAVVRLPRSAFLDQGHIRTVCTRVQFAADNCPKGSAYGHVRAFSPLLDEPLEGFAYLRSSNNLLPDLVFDLKGIVDIEASARIDSIEGGIRATFAGIPDAPVSKVVVDMQGGKKGLIVNSRNLCDGPSHARVGFDAQNGKELDLKPLVKPKNCSKRAPKKQKRNQR